MPRSNVVRSVTSGVSGVALCLAALVVPAMSASAAPAPVVPVSSTGISADALPTVQVNGVVWAQAVVGSTVYAGGSFSSARPAGASPGTSLTPRTNLLAYNITTGALVTSFAPQVNGQIYAVAPSPDGSRVYIGGDFTSVNGQVRSHVAAFDTATGQLSTAFKPTGVNGRVRGMVATGDSVYVGGGFYALSTGQTRNNLAAFRASDGAALAWNPSADLSVWTVAVSGDGQWVFAGGQFTHVNGLDAYGLAKIGGTNGILDTTWKPAVRNAGPNTGISSLNVWGSFVYGTSWSYGSGANLEGTFKIPVANSTTEWVTACHGDIYSAFLTGGVVYITGHPHYCGAMGGGFPQYPEWKYQRPMAWTDSVGGEILNDSLGYPNWHGVANAPSLVDWLPEMTAGSYTGQYQGAWDVDGNADYVVYGGEFPTVNGNGQQGLVRFARRGLAPNREGPRFPAGTFVPRLVPTSSSTVRVSWAAGWDRDDYNLTYKVIRDGATGSPRYTTTAGSSWWSLPALGFVDTGLTPGGTYQYQLVATDSTGNTVWGSTASVTMPSSSSPSNGYAQSVRANGARIYWPMNESSGLTVNDRAAGAAASAGIGVTDGRGDTGVDWNQSGAIAGDNAAALTDNIYSRVYALGSETAPDTFTIQAWVRTTTTRGGRIFGFGDLQNGSSAHRDRHLYMDNSGRIVFGVRAQDNSARTLISPAAYNNNQWHMLTATMSSAGMRLFVDGNLVGSRNDTTAGEAYLGYWRVGGDELGTASGRPGWSPLPASVNFVGGVDELAVYPTALSQSSIQAQYALRTGGGGGNSPPSASFTWSVAALTASFNGSGSSDPDGSVTGYSWAFGDGSTGSGVSPSHTYAAPGTYTVQLTVTDNQGAIGTTTRQVTLADAAVIASDAFDRTVVDGWGQAVTGGSWTLTSDPANFAVGGSKGTIRLAPSSGPWAYLAGTSARDVDLRTAIGFDKPGTGGGVYASAVVRRVGSTDYRLKVRVSATDTTAYLTRTVGGVETVLTTAPLPGVVVAAGDALSLRVQAVGSGATTLNGKVWKVGSPEPGAWTTSTTDSTAGLQSAGAVGLFTYLSGSATNAPVTLSVPDFNAVTP